MSCPMPPDSVDWPAMVAQWQRIEDKLDMLLDALAEHVEPEEQPSLTLDGTYAGQERAAGTPL